MNDLRFINIVCSDGGIQGGFIAGVLDQLLVDHPELMSNISAVTATSASVGTVSYFASFGETHPGTEVWVNELSGNRFSAGSVFTAIWTGRPLYDVDYLIDKVFRERHPLDIAKIHNAPFLLVFPVFNLLTEELEFLWNRKTELLDYEGRRVWARDFRAFDYYEVMRAAKAVPILYDKSVRVGAVPYIDAGQVEPYTLDAPGTQPFPKILIATKYKCDVIESIKYYLAGLASYSLAKITCIMGLTPQAYKNILWKPKVYRSLAEKAEALRASGELLLVIPQGRLKGHRNNTLKDLRHNYSMGRDWVIVNKSVIADFHRKAGFSFRQKIDASKK